MRWGVRDEATDDHMTTELCMKEIQNCQRLSMGPNFVVSSAVFAYLKIKPLSLSNGKRISDTRQKFRSKKPVYQIYVFWSYVLKISWSQEFFWDEGMHKRTDKSTSKVLCVQFSLKVINLPNFVLEIAIQQEFGHWQKTFWLSWH